MIPLLTEHEKALNRMWYHNGDAINESRDKLAKTLNASEAEMTEHDKILRAAIAELRSADTFDSPERRYPAQKHFDALRVVLAAAESTLPKTKLVDVWHVEYAGDFGNPHLELETTKLNAELRAATRRSECATCVRVTGPHKHEVPT